MRSADEVEVVLVQELSDDLGSESEGDSSVVLAPASLVLSGCRRSHSRPEKRNLSITSVRQKELAVRKQLHYSYPSRTTVAYVDK